MKRYSRESFQKNYTVRKHGLLPCLRRWSQHCSVIVGASTFVCSRQGLRCEHCLLSLLSRCLMKDNWVNWTSCVSSSPSTQPYDKATLVGVPPRGLPSSHTTWCRRLRVRPGFNVGAVQSAVATRHRRVWLPSCA